MSKCSYKHCLHTDDDTSDELVENKGKQYHPDCLDVAETIKKITEVYYTEVSNTVVMGALVGTINNLVFDKHVDCHYLLFALNRAVAKKRRIKSPFWLHYIVDDFDTKKAWEAEQTRKLLKEARENSVEDDVIAPSFKQGENLTGFEKIFNGR